MWICFFATPKFYFPSPSRASEPRFKFMIGIITKIKGLSDVKSIFDMCQVEIVYLSSKYDLGNLFL